MNELITIIVALLVPVVVVAVIKIMGNGKQREIKRLPSHVGIVFEDGAEMKSAFVSEVIKWVRQHGVSVLSVYHSRGLSEEVVASIAASGNQVFKASEEVSAAVANDTNKVKVIVLSHRDGRVIPSSFEPCDRLPALKPFSDPELLIIFGNSKSIYGYPPWYLSLTELRFHSPTVSSYSPAALHADLLHYSDTKVLKGV
eukprot:TRINITY_DN20804_c0_g1_i1.p1 TRINITY_DN20804_c0_g1~~TRINITY_DN20804_c0_g1_i1.p1  ORF type:complete len:199 (+),score=23.74 TRINITY_DN20804_c0_g1_i1:79-675(+)